MTKDVRGNLIRKLVQLGALDRSTWRPKLFHDFPRCKHRRQDVRLNELEIGEIRKALEHVRHETKFTLEHNQRMYANRVYGGRLFNA